MFEEIFFPRTAERYRAAPLVEQRERYLVHLRETGARRSTLRKCAKNQVSLVRLLDLKDGGRVRVSQIEAVTASGRSRRAQVRQVGVTQGENTLCQPRGPMAALPGLARRSRT